MLPFKIQKVIMTSEQKSSLDANVICQPLSGSVSPFGFVILFLCVSMAIRLRFPISFETVFERGGILCRVSE